MSENTTTDQTGTDQEQAFDDLTPYAASRVASLVTGKKYTEQSFYGYARTGAIASNYDQWNADGGKKSGYKVEFNGEAFAQWLKGVQSGRIRPSGRNVDYAALADAFNELADIDASDTEPDEPEADKSEDEAEADVTEVTESE
jgi:hypothetical protein